LLLLDSIIVVTVPVCLDSGHISKCIFFCGVLIMYMIIYESVICKEIVNFNIPELYCYFSVLVDTGHDFNKYKLYSITYHRSDIKCTVHTSSQRTTDETYNTLVK